MNKLFEVHKLNKDGMAKAKKIAIAFESLLLTLEEVCAPGREWAIVQTKLEEASFFAKKSMAKLDENQIVQK